MFNPFYALLLPVTTVVDYLLTPRRVRKKEFYADVKFFVGGVHATVREASVTAIPTCLLGASSGFCAGRSLVSDRNKQPRTSN